MVKITFMGAGSTVFAKNVLGDCMCTPSMRDSIISLYDIDSKRLEESELMLKCINKNVNDNRAKIETHLGVENRKQALRDSTFVVNAIQVGGYDPCTITDFEISKKYGLRQTIGDTLGIGGIMRALRTIPVMQDFAKDMEDKLEGRKELIAGINHMGWLLEIKDKNGTDLYPEIRRRAKEKNLSGKHTDMV